MGMAGVARFLEDGGLGQISLRPQDLFLQLADIYVDC